MNETAAAVALDPITVEVIGAALSSIVEETGEALIRASFSTNVKERRDCSTALFDLQGRTLCQAEHIPMHLGSFIGIVEYVLKHHPGAGCVKRSTHTFECLGLGMTPGDRCFPSCRCSPDTPGSEPSNPEPRRHAARRSRPKSRSRDR